MARTITTIAAPGSLVVSSVLTLGTPISLAGTAALFNNIPTTAKIVYVSVKGATYTTPNVAESFSIKLGTSSGLVSSGYAMAGTVQTTGNTTFQSNTNIILSNASNLNSDEYSGLITFVLMDSSTNTWSYSGCLGAYGASAL